MKAMMLLGGALAAMTVPALAQVAGDVPPPEQAAQVAAATAAADAGGEGPYKAEMVSDPTLPTHTVYRPRDLRPFGARAGKMPIVAWGNGACVNVGNRFRYFLTEVASRGYLVIAIGPKGPTTSEWKVTLATDPSIPPAQRPPQSYSAQMTDAIDWAIAENARPGSAYYRKLDTSAVAVMGQSCGGLQAIGAASDRRVRTAVVLNSGTFPEGTPPLGGTGDAIKASLKRLRGATLWMTGDSTDQAFPNGAADFKAVTVVPAVRAWHKGTGHSVHWREPHGGPFTPWVIDWLDWRLKGQTAKRAVFVGAACALCKADGWTVESKGF